VVARRTGGALVSPAEAPLPKTFRQQIADFLAANPDFICSECLASMLALPRPYVAMTTIGLGALESFESAPHRPCGRCGAPTRVIRKVIREHSESTG
jgi:hypothetical protein